MGKQLNTTTVALLPLETIILPGGRMQLSIFEPRYIRMVKESLQHTRNFGLGMLNSNGNKASNQHIYALGTQVQVVDFKSLANGTLGITVAGKELFEIETITTEHDGLRSAKVKLLSPWFSPFAEVSSEQATLAERLQEVYDTYPDIGELYPEKHYHDASWLCARWLELLPLSAEQKHALIASHNPVHIARYICSLFE
ncbi:LON peptidase substrate-binding domain-containing protein [Aliidiomarina quisquiliarum]|uniref:LON peptidase substrate-binding domain-containing protein n=1 Tax=Aliidiomarina quisquiliarum TaxID=2938947 RepID=UPI00208FE9A8|nr:LON peptidase substrate-binding domain-containing protein [Aliidiomarina quisquiliarum]MCO4320889.1 LON peptidase substrate-binding domain-containing protein [Aliidiomarina quisquiliarum]